MADLHARLRTETAGLHDRLEALPFFRTLQALGGAEIVSREVDRFDRRLRGCPGRTVDSASHLIALAWMDERAGIVGALAAVRDWFTDGERFSDNWIANVHALVHALDRAGGG